MKRLSTAVLGLLFVCAFVFLIPADASAQCSAAWAPNTFYAVGANVSYSGVNYRCQQAHTSQIGWEPPNVPALWVNLGACSGGTATPTSRPRATATSGGTPRATATPRPTNTPRPTSTPRTGATPTARPRATSTSRPAPTPTACTSCGSGLPARTITGYWQNFNNGARCLRLADVPTRYNVIAVAFADATGTPGGVTFNLDAGLSTCLGGYTASQFIADMNTVKGRGQRVVISVGGELGRVSVGDSGAASTFANNVASLMSQYGFQGVDIDLENGLNAQYMTQALRSLRSLRPGALVLMAPQTIDMQSSGAAYFRTGMDTPADLINTQFYNSGCMLGCDGMCVAQGGADFITMQTCLHLQNGMPGSRLGVGVPASPSGAGSGYVSPSVVNAAMDCLDPADGDTSGCSKVPATRAKVRGAMTWSINWDASNNYSWVNSIVVP